MNEESPNVTDATAALVEKFLGYGVPPHGAHSLAMYVADGVPTGGFLYAVLCNDLMLAACMADSVNVKLLHAYAKALYNAVPTQAHGSGEKVVAWVRHKGLSGMNEVKS